MRCPVCGCTLFLSTPPSWVATSALHSRSACLCCFYPRHPHGWRLIAARVRTCLLGFYPRHPHGWRRECGRPALCSLRFYPRHPHGWRPLPCIVIFGLNVFLSTPPSRVATAANRAPLIRAVVVSIHATLAGGDVVVPVVFYCRPVSIHATLTGGDLSPRAFAPVCLVSIHATLTGGDANVDGLLCVVSVSIHATLTGGDRCPVS